MSFMAKHKLFFRRKEGKRLQSIERRVLKNLFLRINQDEDESSGTFIVGVGRLFDTSRSYRYDPYPPTMSSIQQDVIATNEDWDEVGADMWHAIMSAENKRYDKEKSQ